MPRRLKKAKQQVAPVAAPPPVPSASPRLRLLCATGVGLALLAVYVATVIPTMVDQDSGELVAAAHTLGIAHPTGYPLWVLLGRLFDLLPLGHTSAYRVALLSAVAAAGASGILTWLAISLTGLPTVGVAAGLAFGLWFPTWSQAVRAEVYTLSGLLFSLFLAALLRWDRRRSRRDLFWLALAAGFVSMHHRTAFLAVAPTAAVTLWVMRSRRARTWLPAAALFTAPFLIYLYLPIRAAVHPAVNWSNPDTLERFWRHMSGAQYQGFALKNSLDVAMQQAAKLAGECLAGTGVLSVLLALVVLPLLAWGFLIWYRRQPLVAGSLGVGAAVLIIWVLEWGETTDLKVFLEPLGAAAVLCGAMGLAQLRFRLPNTAVGRAATPALGALVALVLLQANWARSDESGIWQHRDRWVAELSQMDKHAIFISDFDVPSFGTIYLQNVEGLRKDITLLRAVGMMQDWYRGTIEDPELRRNASECWDQAAPEFGFAPTGSPRFWATTARFAQLLAERYRGRRTVYALHGPMGAPLPEPPYFIGLSEDLVKLAFEKPDPVVATKVSKPLAELPGGVELAGFELEGNPDKVKAGDIIGFRARWRLSAPVPPMTYFALGLALDSSPAFRWPSWRDKGRFEQAFPLVYGLRDLPPSPPATVYEQRGTLVIPSNASPGTFGGVTQHDVLLVSLSPTYPPQFDEWTPVRRLVVLSGSLPTNGP